MLRTRTSPAPSAAAAPSGPNKACSTCCALLKDGSYLLEVPYSNDQELVMDLLRHGTDVEVLGPPQLRRKLAQIHREAANIYSSG